jgi:hypothetical protein
VPSAHAEWGYCRRVAASRSGDSALLFFAMRLRVDDPELVPELIRFLEARLDMVTARRGANELELSLLGSYGQEEGRETLALEVQAWREADPNRRRSVRFLD